MTFKNVLNYIRHKSKNDVELGFAFEKVCKIFFENDLTQSEQYTKVWHYKDWAKEHHSYSENDIGIDLVAKLRYEEGFCAIQCKCYKSDHSISKSDIDSFISASSTSDFERLVLIDTSTLPLGKNSQSVLDNIDTEYIRIQQSAFDQSRINWNSYINQGEVKLNSKKELKDHQIKALNAIKKGLEEDDRGKMIMACGTGKTFTSLRIAEEIAGPGKKVLYMVPSLALMSQTVCEWKNDASSEFIAFSACSDEKVGKRKRSSDQLEITLNDLAFPATTNSKKLSEQVKKADNSKMIVVFSTYHSINVISKSQFEEELGEFDLIICDEAHRTTGATLVGDDDSNFIRIHSNENVKGKKRLYMTATPRIYGENARKKEDKGEVSLASMDDEDIFGKNLFHRGFGWAVENGLLSDYKVVVLMMDEQIVSNRVQKSLTEGTELELDDATKMVGCYKALAKIGIDTSDKKPMKKALAFCQNIRTSELFSGEFSNVVNEYTSNEENTDKNQNKLKVELFHVDGTFNAEKRNEKLNWLKEKTDQNICRVLTNARCLSEGVDVPSLDAIMFLHPRKSQIDVVQSVGRVMRKSEGKNLGYVILPITIAPGVSLKRALDDNDRYKVIWQILNALRAHDDRFDSTINRIGLGEDVSNRIEIIDGTSPSELEATTAIIEDVKTTSKKKKEENDSTIGRKNEGETNHNEEAEQLSFMLTDLSQAIKAKIVEKCGTRDYWENWANDISKIAQQHISRINSIVLNSGTKEREAFISFVEEIRDDLNSDISETDAVEMLAQHIITRPVFDTLFKGNRFTSENAVSKAMETILSQIYDRNIDTQSRSLEKFYLSVKRRSEDIITSTGRQTLILELYDRFFRNAFPLMTQKLGIVYTPIQVVDFINNSVEVLMQEKLNTSLANENVHILDPFTGTGTFISRLLQSDIFSRAQLIKKFNSEIHANEIVLLAYYIACINIEAVYFDLVKEDKYSPFQGIVLTDTFQLYEQEKDMIANLLPDNSGRRTSQKKKNITVIIGNPPYSAKQKDTNDNAQNLRYKNLDNQIENFYAKHTDTTLKGALYDSYVRAFRWASDRISDKGIIAYVSGSGWLTKKFGTGIRKSLYEEFNHIYIIDLKGDIRLDAYSKTTKTQGENIFGSASMTGIAIVFLVRDGSKNPCKIHYCNKYGNASRNEKLNFLSSEKNIKALIQKRYFQKIFPTNEQEWINKSDPLIKKSIILGDKKKQSLAIFTEYSIGLQTQRDAWCYNSSPKQLSKNILVMINEFNNHLKKYNQYPLLELPNLVDQDKKKMSWSRHLYKQIKKGEEAIFKEKFLRKSLYRPFTYQICYADPKFNDEQGKTSKIFPNNESENMVILVSGIGSQRGVSALGSKSLPDRQTIQNGQCFPLYLYSKDNGENLLFSITDSTRKFGINNSILDIFTNKYDKKIKEEDLFFYIYGLLHNKEYKIRFEINLLNELPRIPPLNSYDEFLETSMKGKQLFDLHTNFEKVKRYPLTIKKNKNNLKEKSDPISFYRVEKMKFTSKDDRSSITYNQNIVMENIPDKAYEYFVNGKPALEWVMERQCIRQDKKSGIINDANDYANEVMKNPSYPLELFQRVITVSLETISIIDSLPQLNID